MNTYRVIGKYNLWNSEELPRRDFSRIVLAGSTQEAIEMCVNHYRLAVIIVTQLRDEDILMPVTPGDGCISAADNQIE